MKLRQVLQRAFRQSYQGLHAPPGYLAHLVPTVAESFVSFQYFLEI